MSVNSVKVSIDCEQISFSFCCLTFFFRYTFRSAYQVITLYFLLLSHFYQLLFSSLRMSVDKFLPISTVLSRGIQSTFLSKMSLKRNANLAFWLVLPRSFFSPTVSPLTSCEGTSSMSLSAQASQSVNTYINTNNNNN